MCVSRDEVPPRDVNITLLRASHPQQALWARLERMIHHGKGLPCEAAFGVNGRARRQQRASHVLAMMARWRSRLKKVQTRPVIEVGHRGRVSPAFLTHFSMVVFIAFCLERDGRADEFTGRAIVRPLRF